MSLRFTLSIAMLSSGCALSAFANTLHIAESGTFGSATTATAFSVSNGTFACRYDLDSNPVSTGASIGPYYEVAVSNFSYTLNGVSIPAANPGAILFSIGSSSMSVCFSSPCAGTDVFTLEGPQFYSGDRSAPTILVGIYTPTSAQFGDDFLASTSDVAITAVDVAPEPSSLALLGTGMFAAAAVIKRRFA